MAAAKIQDRTKYLGGPWDVVKGKNPVLSKGLFKPPMDPLVDQYDKHKAEFDKLRMKKTELKALITSMTAKVVPATTNLTKLSEESGKAARDISASSAKHGETLNKYNEGDDPDTKGVYGALTALADDCTANAAMYKTIGEKMSSTMTEFAGIVKKTAADYKSGADAIEAKVKKLEADMNGLDDQMRKLAKNYQDIAIKADKDDTADSIRGFLTMLP